MAMTQSTMDRRRFLRLSGSYAAGATMLAAGVGLTAAPSGAWALEVKALNEHQGATLLKVARHVFPHETLADVYYAGVVQSLDGKAAADAALKKKLADGIAAMDAATSVNWLDLSNGYQLEVLTKAGKDVLGIVKGDAVVSLYNNQLVWRHFGYEGSSAEHGGYIDRGFDDLSWLPDPDAEASPPAA
jgi:hypothetical protein